MRVYFLGIRHPNPDVGEMRRTIETLELSDELGLTGTHVFFNDDWVEYDDRPNYLLEADVGVSTHLDHVETAFSFRTRVLDYLWAGLPVVATQGDALAGRHRESGCRDRRAARATSTRSRRRCTACSTIPSCNESCRAAARSLATDFRWTEVLAPLIEYCRNPVRAPDLLDPELAATVRDPLDLATWRPRTIRRDVDRALALVRRGELTQLDAEGRHPRPTDDQGLLTRS